MRKQCELLGVARSTVDLQTRGRGSGRHPHQTAVGRDLHEGSVPWQPPSGDGAGARLRREDQPQAGRATAPRDGPGDDLVQAAHQHSGRRAPQVSLSAAQPGHRPARPGVVRRHHLRADAPRPRLPVRGDGLEFAQGAGLVAFQHHGNRSLPGGPGDGAGLHRQGSRRSSTPTRAASSPRRNGRAA